MKVVGTKPTIKCPGKCLICRCIFIFISFFLVMLIQYSLLLNAIKKSKDREIMQFCVIQIYGPDLKQN